VDSIATERKGYYSNCGPRVDVHAPGTWIVSSMADSTGSGWGSTVQDSRNSSYYLGRDIGTSMSAPQVTGVLACILEIYPSMTPAQALTYIQTYSKTGQLNDTGGTSPTWTSDTQSLQGAPNRYLYLRNETPTTGPTWPKQNYWVRPTSGRTYPRTRIKRKG
jgi:subtilisin family serine protease